MYVTHRFELENTYHLRHKKPQFGFYPFGEAVYYRTYSRNIDGVQEHWPDTVIRVINGTFSIRKDWYIKNHIHWDEAYWQEYAREMSSTLFDMHWLPPGRGLFAMGTELIYQRGSMPLYNCGATELNEIDDFCWLMDALMNGCGIGWMPTTKFKHHPFRKPWHTYSYTIPDTREGWVDSVRQLLWGFQTGCLPDFDYSLLRAEGMPLKTFGGKSSGPQPLINLHYDLEKICYRYLEDEDYPSIVFQADVANLIGVCVVTGGIRRSAEIGLAPISMEHFADLKDYKRFPEREAWGWMSNNSVALEKPQDFLWMYELADSIRKNGEPGYVNWCNFPKGRLGHDDSLRPDLGRLMNPCGEIVLEDKELCNVVETLPTRCPDVTAWYKACEHATFYASTVALLPTHSNETNSKIIKNRRIGVSIIDFANWKDIVGVARVTRYLRVGYKQVRETNQKLAAEAGVPESIRVTAIKPGGSVPKIAGRVGGAGYPNFNTMLRRMRVQENTKFAQVLIDAGVPYEKDAYSQQTLCFEFPIIVSGRTDATLWEQAFNIILLQREWADNSVSNTLNFHPDEDIAAVLSYIAPHVKSVSALPVSDKGVYKQMPEEGINREEYLERISKIREIDWSKFQEDGSDEKYCNSERCVLNVAAS